MQEQKSHGPVTEVNLYTTGDKLLKPGGSRYVGYYHQHLDGTYMTGKDHVVGQPRYELILNPDWIAAQKSYNKNPLDPDLLDIPKTPAGNKLILEEEKVKSDAYKPLTHQTIKRKWNNEDYTAVIDTSIFELIEIKVTEAIEIIVQPDDGLTAGELNCVIGFHPTLSCKAISNRKSKLKYRWLKDGEDIVPGTGYNDMGKPWPAVNQNGLAYLSIRGITPDQGGYWTCEITDEDDNLAISNGVLIEVNNPNALEIFGSNILKNPDAKQDLTYWQPIGGVTPVPLSLDYDEGNYHLKNAVAWDGVEINPSKDNWAYNLKRGVDGYDSSGRGSSFDDKRRDQYSEWKEERGTITPADKGFREDKNSRYFYGGWADNSHENSYVNTPQTNYSTMRQEIDLSEAADLIDSQNPNGNGKIKGVSSVEADLWGWLGSVGWTDHISRKTSHHAGKGANFDWASDYSTFANEWTAGGGFDNAYPLDYSPFSYANHTNGKWDGRNTFATSYLRTQVHDKVYVTIDLYDKNETLLNPKYHQIENHQYYKDLPHALWYLMYTAWGSKRGADPANGIIGTRWYNVLEPNVDENGNRRYWKDRITSITDYWTETYPPKMAYGEEVKSPETIPGLGGSTANPLPFVGRDRIPMTPYPTGVLPMTGPQDEYAKLKIELGQLIDEKKALLRTKVSYGTKGCSDIHAADCGPLAKSFDWLEWKGMHGGGEWYNFFSRFFNRGQSLHQRGTSVNHFENLIWPEVQSSGWSNAAPFIPSSMPIAAPENVNKLIDMLKNIKPWSENTWQLSPDSYIFDTSWDPETVLSQSGQYNPASHLYSQGLNDDGNPDSGGQFESIYDMMKDDLPFGAGGKASRFIKELDRLQFIVNRIPEVEARIAVLLAPKPDGFGVIPWTPQADKWGYKDIMDQDLGVIGTPTIATVEYTNGKAGELNRGLNVAGFSGLAFADIYKKSKFFYSENTRIKIPRFTRKAVITVKWSRDWARGFTVNPLGEKYNPNKMKNSPPGNISDNNKSRGRLSNFGLEFMCAATNMGVQLNVLGTGKPYEGAEEFYYKDIDEKHNYDKQIWNITPNKTVYAEGSGWGIGGEIPDALTGMEGISQGGSKPPAWEEGDPWFMNPDHQLVVIVNGAFELREDPENKYDVVTGELKEGEDPYPDDYDWTGNAGTNTTTTSGDKKGKDKEGGDEDWGGD